MKFPNSIARQTPEFASAHNVHGVLLLIHLDEPCSEEYAKDGFLPNVLHRGKLSMDEREEAMVVWA